MLNKSKSELLDFEERAAKEGIIIQAKAKKNLTSARLIAKYFIKKSTKWTNLIPTIKI
jgi:hypothetical protein